MSDDRLGGGDNDQSVQAINQFKKVNENMFGTAWTEYYKGIFRCNSLINYLGQITWDNDTQKGQLGGEVYLLRTYYYYFDLARMFGTVPLITEPIPLNNPKAPADALFGQIAAGLKLAIELMPTVTFPDMDKSRLGHATKWAAQALMARVFLFYTGYY